MPTDDPDPAAVQLRRHIEATAELIESVHSLPLLPPIDILFNAEPFRRGGYKPAVGGEPPHIALSLLGVSPRLTFTHEWGHYIDNFLNGFNGWASIEGDEFHDILEAVKSTQAYQSLLRQYSVASMSLTLERIEAIRLLDEAELWARAYAQYIVLRSNDPIMIEEIVVRRSAPLEIHSSMEYWEWNDFALIAKTIDRWMHQKGWRP